MAHHNLCLAWNWEFDRDFVNLLEAACKARQLTLLQVTPENLAGVIAGLESGEIAFDAFFDRAAEADERFLPIEAWAFAHSALRLNPRECSLWAVDKAVMHLELAAHGVLTPDTLILPAYAEQPEIPAPDLSPLGGSFAIKPARGGGGEGVVLEAGSPEQVLAVRQQYPKEKYLLQAHVTPQVLEGRPAWFRILLCAGAIYACWWDPHSHAYTPVTAGERGRYALRSLYEVPARIAQICQLHLFSTEIALAQDGRFLVVDYVNDPVDLRLQSRAADGVPDAVVESIARRLVRLIDLQSRDQKA
jgi:hypothetical protein